MILTYVGALPRISSKGVGFDYSQPDRYTFLNAAVELMDALDFGPTPTTQHLHNTAGKEYSGRELMELLTHYCRDFKHILESREEKADGMLKELTQRVHDNKIIDEFERRAWLKNIELMHDYHLQYFTNESAYRCALATLAQEVHDARIKEVGFPMIRNYGIVLHDLIPILEHRRPPIDAELSIDKQESGFYVRLAIRHR